MLMPEQIESGRPLTVDYAFKLAHEIVKVIGAQTFKEKYFEYLRVIKVSLQPDLQICFFISFWAP